MKKILLITFLLSTLFVCNGQTTDSIQINEKSQVKTNKTEQIQAKEPIKLLDVAAFKKGITNPNIQLIDVRTPNEYSEGHIENAILIDYFSPNFKEKLLTLNKDKPLYLYCKIGGRSGKASRVLADLGFKEIYDLEGGYMAWEKQ